VSAAERGHDVTLFDAATEIGGQLNIARQAPGKQEFNETLRYYRHQLAAYGIETRLGVNVAAEDVRSFDEVVIATGVTPRVPEIAGLDHPMVLSYVDVLRDKASVGNRVAILGAGGIGFDVAEFLTDPGDNAALNPAAFLANWGVDTEQRNPGGLMVAQRPTTTRQVTLLQRKTSKVGAGLGKTTGWIHRTELKHRGVAMIAGATYDFIDDEGLHYQLDGEKSVLAVDTVVVCTGQEPNRMLYDELVRDGISAHLIGGADVAAELDAKRAIDQGTRLAATL
jgi:2,4-dienoyl-CoA reductase (NADPH2)